MTKDDWRVEALRQVGGWLIAAALLYGIIYIITPNYQDRILKLENQVQHQLNRIENKIDKLDTKLSK